MWVVHHEERHSISDAEIACTDKLAVTLEIGESDEIRSEDFDESRGTSAVLQVGPACFTYGRHVEAVAGVNEVSFAPRERVSLRCALHRLMPSEVFVLS